MAQYKTQYGTVFAVKEHNGSPAIMCRAELSETWSLSSMITPFTPGAWTAEELQVQLDNWAATKGWQPVAEPASACLCETCTCTGCHEDCFGHCKGCGHPVDHCNSYQTEGEKRLRAEPASAEPPVIVDEGSGPDEGFPEWVRPMVEAFLRFPFFRELPAFTSSALRYSDPAQHHQGGTLADGVYDTGPKGITFFVFRSDSSDQYREAHYTWADFVRRCKAAGLAPEPHQDKEDAPCNTEPTAPTGAAAATTAASAAPQPSQAAGTSTTSASGADANNSPDVLTAPQPTEGCADIAANVPSSLPTFDFAALDADTAEKLRGITDCVMELYQTYAWGMAYQVGRAHDLLCGDRACETVSQAHKRNNQHSENTFTAWCAYIGVERRSAYNLLNAYRLICKATPEQQKNLQLAPAKLLYEAGKKDTPDQLANAVLDGDITSHKQYQEAMAQLKAEQAARKKAEKDAAYYRTDSENARAAADTYHRKYEDANTRCNILLDQQADYIAAKQDAESRARAAENRADGAEKLAELRGTENTELKAKIRELENQPRDVAVVQPGEEQIEAWRREGADRMAATMQETVRKANQEKLRAQNQVADLQEQLATARPDADACQRTVDILYETTENIRLLLRSQLKQARLSPTAYGKVVAHVLQAAHTLLDTVRVCAPDGYDMDSEEDDDFE